MEMSNDFTGEFPVCGMIALKRGHAHWWALPSKPSVPPPSPTPSSRASTFPSTMHTKATSLVWIGDRAFLGSADLAGTLMVGPAVKSIGTFAFANTKLTGLVFGVSPPVRRLHRQ